MKVVHTKDVPWGEGMQRGSFFQRRKKLAGDDAHQLINDGSEVLVYFAMSVSKGVDITEYPDSGKVHAVVGAAPNLKSLVFRQKDAVGYFDGEPDAE